MLLKPYKNLIILGLLLHFVAAIFSVGFSHPDEHFQILEFINLKLGGIDQTVLGWDYHVALRSWMQPALYYPFVKFFHILTIKNPFFIATFLRLISSMLGWFALILLAKSYLETFRKESSKKILFYLTNLLWFIPFIQARTSSENLSASFIFLALFFFSLSGMGMGVISGIMMGLSFWCRFQMGIVILFFFLWIVIFRRDLWKTLVGVAIGLTISSLLAILIDCWGYGRWELTPINYFVQNIVLGKASHFGVMPWWGYLKLTFIKGVPPLSFVFMLFYVVFWIWRPKSIFTWITLPFFIVHTVIGHKELRFLSYLYLLIPFVTAYAIEIFEERFIRLFNIFSKRYFLTVFKVLNYILLIIIIFKPAHTPIKFYKYLYGNQNEIRKLYVFEEITGAHLDLILNFYAPTKPEIIPIPKENKIPKERLFFFTSRYSEYKLMKDNIYCKERYSTYPRWIFNWNYFNWLNRSSIWMLWECDRV